MIVGAVLIALIVGIGTYYKRKLRKQYQKQPYQSVTGTDLEAEISGGEAYKRYKTRQDRLTMLVKALCAAVVIMGGLVYASVNWWQESEPERIARAEQKRIEKAEKQRLQEEAEKKRLQEKAEKQRLQEEAEKKRLQEEAEKKRLQEEAEKKRLQEEAEQPSTDAGGIEARFQQWKAKRIAKAKKKVDEKWKKYQELVDAKIWIDSADILKQQCERLSEQAEAYKNEFYKLSSQSGKLKNSNAAEEYCLTVEDLGHRQNELSKQIEKYKYKKSGLLGSGSYEEELDSAYDAFAEASEDLMKAKALTQDDFDDLIFDGVLVIWFIVIIGMLIWSHFEL